MVCVCCHALPLPQATCQGIHTFAVTAMVPAFFMGAFRGDFFGGDFFGEDFFGEGVVLAGEVPLVWALVRPSVSPSKMAAASCRGHDTQYSKASLPLPLHTQSSIHLHMSFVQCI